MRGETEADTGSLYRVQLELEWRGQLKLGKVEFCFVDQGRCMEKGLAAGAVPAVVEVRREVVTLEAAEIPSQDVALNPLTVQRPRAGNTAVDRPQGREQRAMLSPRAGVAAVEGNQLHDAFWCDGGGPL